MQQSISKKNKPKSAAGQVRSARKKEVRNEVKQLVRNDTARLTSGVSTNEALARIRKSGKEYIKSLIDPATYVGVRYPDTFARRTATFHGKIIADTYYFQAANVVGEPEGLYLSYLSASLISPLRQYQLATAGAIGRWCQYACTGQTDHYGLSPLVEDSPTPASSQDTMLIRGGDTYNLKAQYSYDDQDFSSPPMRSLRADSTVLYGVPVTVGPALPAAIRVVIHTLQASTGAVSPYSFQVITATNSTAFTPMVSAAGAHTHTLNITGASLAAAGVINANGSAPLPGLGFRITYGAVGIDPDVITGFNVNMLSANNAIIARFVDYSLPDEEECCEKIDQYRVVSMCNWMEYEGSDLNNGGQAAAIMYRGGQSPSENGLWSYRTVAATPTSYQGHLKDGTYAFWLPSNYSDMDMKTIDSNRRWEMPYIVNVGLVSTTTQVRALRYRIDINYEFISASQLFTYLPVEPDLESLELAAVVLRNIPTAMANGEHLKIISDAVRKVGNAVKGIAGWASDNKEWLAPLAAKAAMMAAAAI
jgi:hypothetical protein